MVITFDFDDTLLWWAPVYDEDGDFVEQVPAGPNPRIVPKILRDLQRPGVEVHIVTSRGKNRRADTESWLKKLEIPVPPERIHFTNGELKRDTLEELGSQLHYDDDPVEIENLPPGCRGVLAPIHPGWRKVTSESHLRGIIRSLL